VQAAVDAAATALVGQRFTPHHMLCAPMAIPALPQPL